MTTDAAGDLFIAGNGPPPTPTSASPWVVLEKPAGQTAFSLIDYVPDATCKQLATDAGGDVYAAGWAGGGTALVRKLVPGAGGYVGSTVYQVPWTTFHDGNESYGSANLRVIDSGPAAGIYVVGDASGKWKVIKSSNGGQSWAQVDLFKYDSTTAGAASYANAVIGDAAGNLYVAGEGYKATITGGTSKKPVYQNIPHWLVRKSSDGGVSWSTVDDFQLASMKSADAFALGTDLAGNVYATGNAIDGAGVFHAIVRSNEGGAWSISDNVTGYGTFTAFTTDPSGNLYTGTNAHWLIRSAPSPIAVAPTIQAFSSLGISESTLALEPILDLTSGSRDLLRETTRAGGATGGAADLLLYPRTSASLTDGR